MTLPQAPPLVATAGSWQLCCHFHALGDRVGHRIVAIDPAGRSIDLVESIEVDAISDDWPPSPPLQDLSVEEIEGEPTALAVGRAGRSHWSSSIQTVSDGEAALVFDIACRCEANPQRLGSAYRCLGGALFVDRLLVLEGAQVAFQPSSARTQVEAHGAWCRIEHDPGDMTSARQTVGWRYQVKLTPAAVERTTE